MTLTVSVALCTFNGRAYIEEQIRSILRQTVSPDEVVVSDDGSTDGTGEFIQELWPNDGPTLRVVRNERPLGVTANFERALSLCAGDIILLSDQDDVWAPDRIAGAVEYFAAHPEQALLFTDARLVDHRGDPLGTTLWESLEISQRDLHEIASGRAMRTLLRRNLATGATMVLRRSLLDAARPFPATWVHDEWLAMIAATQEAVGWSHRRSIDYRQHAANQIGAARPTLRRKIGRLIEPRGDRNRALVARAQALVDHLAQRDAPEEVQDLARGKLAHETARAALPAGRLWRIAPVLRSFRRGDYDRYSSRGRLDVLRDLLQPDS